MLRREQWGGGDGGYVDLKRCRHEQEQRQQQKKSFVSETVEMIRLCQDIDILEWEDAIRDQERAGEFPERRQMYRFVDSEDDEQSDDVELQDADSNGVPSGYRQYGNEIYDPRLGNSWVENAKPTGQGVVEARSTLKGRLINRKQPNILPPHGPVTADSPVPNSCHSAFQCKWRYIKSSPTNLSLPKVGIRV